LQEIESLVFASKLKPKEKEEKLIDLKAMHAFYRLHCQSSLS